MPKSSSQSNARHSGRQPNTKVRVPVFTQDASGKIKERMATLNPKARAELQNTTHQKMQEHIDSLSKEQRQIFDQLRDIPDENETHSWDYQDVLDGHVPVEISHGGGEMKDIAEELNTELNGKKQKKRRDRRKRWDSVQRRVLGFRAQMKAMTDAYIKWAANQGEFGMEEGQPPIDPEMVERHYKVKVIDIFSTYEVHAPMLSTDVYTTSCLVGQGLIPCSPWAPKLAVSTRVLEMFRVARLRCPTLTVHSWIKTLSDLHGIAFKPYSGQQFTTCFDVYLEILRTVDDRVKKALGRDAADWRLKNCCPGCTYKLDGEAKLIFEMLMTADGNNFLSRVLSKRPDPRTAGAGGDYFLSREKVDLWAKEVLAQHVKVPVSDDPQEDSECRERWKNMSEELTSKMWSIFDETGVSWPFAGTDLSCWWLTWSEAYGLAIFDALMDAFGADCGLGYDIGCGSETTIKNSPLGPKANLLRFKMLVGAFHGHAHNRKCQLRFLATYVKGLGLEDLEGCERLFSRSNALSKSVRYASVFHRRQLIAMYLEHLDTYETYTNLSTFLVNNYKQAVEILDTQESLEFAMEQAGISGPHVFEERLAQEKAYLDSLSKEPQTETDQMEYYQHLVDLDDRKETFDTVFGEGSKANGIAKRHARENYDKALAAVQESERKLGVATRWTPDSKEWADAALLVSTRRYRICVGRLELLVVKRLFELTKMNMSQTGYKLRRHIAKALQVRSKAIGNALNRYNLAAKALNPPRRTLSWAEVIDYTFLSDFDILRDPDGNAALRPWCNMFMTYFGRV
ncbi:hypothetical protein B0H11DRAFT_1912051 [Mycena galericulata]|nr:hypothetical protein B0H11DRAFT_1912051 [Mycena galericulata]